MNAYGEMRTAMMNLDNPRALELSDSLVAAENSNLPPSHSNVTARGVPSHTKVSPSKV